jgi:hypothetical protein
MVEAARASLPPIVISFFNLALLAAVVMSASDGDVKSFE